MMNSIQRSAVSANEDKTRVHAASCKNIPGGVFCTALTAPVMSEFCSQIASNSAECITVSSRPVGTR
jgi:hypothetical protein